MSRPSALDVEMAMLSKEAEILRLRREIHFTKTEPWYREEEGAVKDDGSPETAPTRLEAIRRVWAEPVAAMSIKRPTCATCPYYFRTPARTYSGECRMVPPVVMVEGHAVWPPVEPQMWCGKHPEMMLYRMTEWVKEGD